MKKLTKFTLLACTLILAASTQAKIITVNTANNTDFSAGKTNLVTAINALADGDTINFNIPGSGPHYLVTPVGGYPVLTNHNLLVDGYTQPGSAPNSNPILAANNAQIKIVIASTNGAATAYPGPGYAATELATLFIVGTNCHLRGLDILGPGQSFDANSHYGIAINNTADDTHVSGCWIGVYPNGTTLAPPDKGVTSFGGAVATVPFWPKRMVMGVAKGAATTAEARAQFNVVCGTFIAFHLEGKETRISGNFINVLPNGLQDINTSDPRYPIETQIELGRGGNNLVIGVDGDGVHDAEERNVIGGVIFAGDKNTIEHYGGGGNTGAARTNMIIAGNYFGMAVDGVTRFTNSMRIIDSLDSISTLRFGTDSDGVSDDLEGNVISMNYPFSSFFPTPSFSFLYPFCNFDAGARVSLRGNKLIGNNLAPYSYADGTSGAKLTAFTNYAAPFMDVNSANGLIPSMTTTNIYPTLSGAFAPGIAPYTNITIDVYQLDPEGRANGQTFNFAELMNPDGSFNGFPQGKKYLGSFAVANTGSFSVNASGLDFGLGAVTVTANYSADPVGTHNGRVHTSNFSNPGYMLPGGIDSVRLTHIVNDVALWYDNANSRVTNGFVNLATQKGTLGNWEPYIDVLGDSTFLVGFNTYADDQTPPAGATITAPAPFQRFAVALQPAAGGAAKVGEHFYTDAGAPYRGVANYRRQNGNPERVAGDQRYGAANFITMAEASLGQGNPAFQSDSRWTSNVCYVGANAYVTVQTFSLNPATLTQTPLAKAFDPIYGNFVTVTAPATQTQVSRTGGRPVCLDNGNFVVVSDDRTAYLDPDTEVSTFSIITPAGAVVKSATLVSLGDQWDNVTAFKGGFAVRPAGGLLYFYDNAGNLLGSVNHNTSSGLSFDTGRGDGLRTASDIRSHYVYMASKSGNSVWVAAWDANTRAFVGKAQVDDQGIGFSNDRVSLAVDALDRMCVAYVHKPTADFQNQVAARVLRFDGANFTYLTHSFFPFVNYDPDGVLSPIGDGITTVGPSVAMTTRQICIAAKATINSTNNPAGGGDTLAETTVYTVISHPAPVAAPRPTITMTKSGGNLNLSWNPEDGLFTVQTRESLSSGSWVNATAGNVVPPVSVPAGTGPLFVRLAR